MWKKVWGQNLLFENSLKIPDFTLLIKFLHFAQFLNSNIIFRFSKVDFVTKNFNFRSQTHFLIFYISLVPRERFFTYFTKWRLEQKWINFLKNFKAQTSSLESYLKISEKGFGEKTNQILTKRLPKLLTFLDPHTVFGYKWSNFDQLY